MLKPPPDNPLRVAYSDAAHRLSDAVALALTAEGLNASGRWVAARLSDGGTDGKLYASKAEAIRFQLHEDLCAYVCIPPTGMTPRQAENYLSFTRRLYDAGLRISDPDREVIAPERLETWTSHGLIVPKRGMS